MPYQDKIGAINEIREVPQCLHGVDDRECRARHKSSLLISIGLFIDDWWVCVRCKASVCTQSGGGLALGGGRRRKQVSRERDFSVPHPSKYLPWTHRNVQWWAIMHTHKHMITMSWGCWARVTTQGYGAVFSNSLSQQRVLCIKGEIRRGCDLRWRPKARERCL